LDLAKGDLGQLAEQVQASPLRYALVAALDDWVITLTKGGMLHGRVLAVSRQADPDGWRDQVRDPANWDDTPKLKGLAAAAPVAQQQPQILLLLAFQLKVRGHKAEAAQ